MIREDAVLGGAKLLMAAGGDDGEEPEWVSAICSFWVLGLQQETRC